MNKPGYYYSNREQGNPDGVDDLQTNTYQKVGWKKSLLRKDGKDVFNVTGTRPSSGLQVSPDGKQLLLDGVVVARSGQVSVLDGKTNKFGDISLIPGASVINVTLADYNTLRSGGVPTGYRKYDPKAVYNIVDDVASAEQHFYYNTADEDDLLWNNMQEDADDSLNVRTRIPHNERDNRATFINMAAPHLSVYEPTPRITPGGLIEFSYMVDTRHMDGINRANFGDTFTIIVEDQYGNMLARRTTYAGVFKCVIGPFVKHELIDDEFVSTGQPFVGEGWWRIYAIDSNGVSSVTHYFDFLSREAEAENFLEPDAALLAQWGIRAYDASDSTTASPEQGWRNKYGLSKLMAKAKADGHNGLRLPVGGTYYIDYHKNVASGFKWSDSFALNAPVDLGQHSYSLMHIYTEDGVKKREFIPLPANGEVTFNEVTYQVGADPFSFIRQDGAHLYRDSEDSSKICVGWYGYALDSETEVYTSSRYLRLTQEPRLVAPVSDTDPTPYWEGKDKSGNWLVADGWYYHKNTTVPYVKNNGYVGGDYIVFPDNFTLDLNGSTLKGVQCIDIRVDAYMARLYNNFNTHIISGKKEGDQTIKGKIEGIYSGFDFKGSFLAVGSGTSGVVAEGISNIAFYGCRYCSFEDIESVGSMGYDCRDESGGHSDGLSSGIKMIHLGYYDHEPSEYLRDDGNGNTDADAKDSINPGILAKLNQDSTDCKTLSSNPQDDGTDAINLVHSVRYTCTNTDLVVRPLIYEYHYNCGKQHEYFVTWYKNYGTDANPDWRFVETVKTQMYQLVKKPAVCGSGKARVVVSGYGLSKEDSNGKRVISLYDSTHGKSFELLTMYNYKNRGRNNLFSSCYIHDTRTCAITGCQSKGIVFDHCEFDNIAIEKASRSPLDNMWAVTTMLGDLEEGWQYRDNIVIKNCVARKTHENAKSVIQINTARNFLFSNNDGFALKDCGGIESAWIHDAQLRELRISRNYFFERPCCYYRRVTVGRVSYRSNDERPFLYREDLTKVHKDKNGNDSIYRMNRCDDPIDNTVAFTDCVSPLLASDKEDNKFEFHLFRSKFGNRQND